MAAAKTTTRTTLFYIQNDCLVGVPGYEGWWNVLVAEVTNMPSVTSAREECVSVSAIFSDAV